LQSSLHRWSYTLSPTWNLYYSWCWSCMALCYLLDFLKLLLYLHIYLCDIVHKHAFLLVISL
jgi:hypothetical protein